MTSKEVENPVVIDHVGPVYSPIWSFPPGKKAKIRLLAYRTFNYGGYTALLVHEEGNRTYLQGRCPDLGLDAPAGGIAEDECAELGNRRVVQAVFNLYGNAYVLTDDGILFSRGATANGKLGRSSSSPQKFNRVFIEDPVLAIASGAEHVLAMTAKKVFTFGRNRHLQVGGNSESDDALIPKEIYAGDGVNAPKQVACGSYFSAILTKGGELLMCGEGSRTGQGQVKDVKQMTPVSFRSRGVKEVVCRADKTYALLHNKLYGWGNNKDNNLGVTAENNLVLEPQLIELGGDVKSVRCAWHMVLVQMTSKKVFYWGKLTDGTFTPSRRNITGHTFPREVFSKAFQADSGGSVDLRK